MSGLRARLGRVPADVWLFLLFLVPYIAVRAWHASQLTTFGIDGSYYAEVARHVRDGLGLTSHLSLYHAGDEQFPHPTSIYPLWPLLLGFVSRVADLETAGHWLPLVLSQGALVLAFGFGRRLWPEPLFPSVLPSFHAGHALVLLLGLQHDFVYYTVIPYTEALSWLLLFAFFWRALVRAGDTGPAWGLEVGLWASALYFARAQLIIVPIAVAGAYAVRLLAGPDRGRIAVQALLALGVIGAGLGAWWRYLSTFVHDPSLSTLLRFDQNRANGLLSEFDVIVNRPTLGATLLDRLEGVGVAYSSLASDGYDQVFWASHWALPAALPFLVAAGWTTLGRDGLRAAVEALRTPRAFAWALMLLVAAGGLASVHLAHKQFNGAWYFDRRQSMVAFLAFWLALGWLLRLRRPVATVLGVLVLSTSTLVGTRSMLRQADAVGGEFRDPVRFRELATWLKREAADSPLTVAMQGGKVQRAALRTGKVGYHWFHDDSSYADILAMTDRLGAKYLIFLENETRDWDFREQGAGRIERDFEALDVMPDGYTIWRRRAAPPDRPPLPAQKVVIVGVDGASWKVMAPMIERRELPNFERLRVEGAWQVDFDTLTQTDSPVVWTSVATGRDPKDHGVTDYTQDVEGVGKVPITSNARKVPALWNLASAGERSVSVINWWASWPAEQVLGRIVSDHANPAAAGWMDGKYYEADQDALRAMQKDTWPPELAQALTPLWLDPVAFPEADFQARAGLTEAQLEQMRAAPFNERTTYSWLKTFYAVDYPHLQIALDQLRTDPADLTMLYLRGPDPVQHYAWDTIEPESYATPSSDLARDTGVVQGVYRYVDTFLGEVMATIGPDTTLIVLSDHGAEPVKDAHVAKREGRPGGHTRKAKGVLFVWGPHARRGQPIGDDAGPLDIAPTVAWAMGLPVAQDLRGRVLAEAFSLDFRERRGLTSVKTWGKRDIDAAASASPADANMLDQLRGLGYIE